MQKLNTRGLTKLFRHTASQANPLFCETLEGRQHFAATPVKVPTAAAVSLTPGTPDLVATSDTGVSKTDNLTNLNNTSTKKLQFAVTGTISGATVGIYSSGTLIGTAVAAGTTTTVTTFGSFTLVDGVRSITARQTTPGDTQSTDSTPLAITVDTVGPTYNGAPVFDYVTVKPQVTINFSEPVAGFASGSITVFKNSPGPTGTTRFQASYSGSSVLLKFPDSPNGILANGDYTVTVSPRAIVDAAGNISTGTASTNFFVLAGDANRDRTVDFNDFLILQNNFGSSIMNFTLGDFDYNGVIDFADFLILQNNFGTSV